MITSAVSDDLGLAAKSLAGDLGGGRPCHIGFYGAAKRTVERAIAQCKGWATKSRKDAA